MEPAHSGCSINAACTEPKAFARSQFIQESFYCATKGIKKLAGSAVSTAQEEEGKRGRPGEAAGRRAPGCSGGEPVADVLMLDLFSTTSKCPTEEAQRGGGACPGSQSTAFPFRFQNVADCWLAPVVVHSFVLTIP